MDKHAAAHVLESIASYLELKGENPFKVRAFGNAAHAVETFPGDLVRAVESGELAEAKGIGPATLEVVREVALTGQSSMLEALMRQVPSGLLEMLRISGLGVTKIRALHEQLGISTVAELEFAARDGRLAKLPRFGDRTAQKILRGIEFLRRTSGFRLCHHAARAAEQLRQAVQAIPGVEWVEIAGSIRRRMEIVRDVDLVVAYRGAPTTIAERLGAVAAIADGLGTADTGFTVRCDDGTAADVYCAPPEHFGHALLWATGSASHLERLAAHAAGHGYRLDRAGLSRGGVPVACADEKALYGALGLALVPPELREEGDEVARAAAGRLPRLVERKDLVGFLHCHSVYSDGTNTLAELADACRGAGYRYLGITDHSVAAAYAGGMAEEAIARQHEEIDALNRGAGDFRILKGVEADILVDGNLDYSPEVLDRFDFVIGSIHSRMELDETAMTQRVLRAMDDPRLAILGHPTGRLLLSRDPYAMDLSAVIERAAERGVAIEINADPHRLDLDWRRCAQARDAGVAISIGADAHSLAALDNAELGVGIARKGWLEARDILNTRDAEGFLSHARSRRKT
jgi:DNA polymerase (family 10)